MFFLIFIVASMAAGFVVQSYETMALKLEVAGYGIEASVPFVLFVVCVAILAIVLLARICIALSWCIYRVKCWSVTKQYDQMGRQFARLSVGNIEDVKQVVVVADKLNKLDRSILALLQGCASFRLGQYEIAEKYFSYITTKGLYDSGLGMWLVSVLKNEKSRDCKLRVLSRLCCVFHGNSWVSIFRLEIALMSGQWANVLTELKFISRHNIPCGHDVAALEEIACYKLAESSYIAGRYKEGLSLLKKARSLQSVLLYARLNVKLCHVKKALEVLESYYKEVPNNEVAVLYLEISQDINSAIDRLGNIAPSSYTGLVLMARKHIALKQYSAAEQCLKRALESYNYVQLYAMMLDVMVKLENLDEIAYWVDAMRRDAVPDMRWQCGQCLKVVEKWDYECSSCGEFNSVVWVE
ncbi:hypothetical protein ANPL_04530 [Anaplasma platys]|uniref:Uncharacterized protein n=2 Tax=Anaplasma platys TaxID=949 RepID=A0A858PZE1_9RICK|nr:hypothetical protein ANPL_04530 [Anaplasma platys]